MQHSIRSTVNFSVRTSVFFSHFFSRHPESRVEARETKRREISQCANILLGVFAHRLQNSVAKNRVHRRVSPVRSQLLLPQVTARQNQLSLRRDGNTHPHRQKDKK